MSFERMTDGLSFNNACLLTTAVAREGYPPPLIPEIALVGRSNVGKSSLINCLVNRKNLARTSSTPGKTATINFYAVDKGLTLVDLPGYGYAKVSKTEKERWSRMIDGYLTRRENLAQVIQLVDIRHPPSEDDKIMLDWTRDCGFHPVIVAAKLDKVKRSEAEGKLTTIRGALRLDDAAIVIPFSAETRAGREDLIKLLEEIVKNVEYE